METKAVDRRLGSKNYSKAFRAMVVAQSYDPTRSIADVAQEHGLYVNMAARWRRAHPRVLQGRTLAGASSIVMIESTREIGERITTGHRYYVTTSAACALTRSVSPGPCAPSGGIGAMHWTLDVAFIEDPCRVRVNNAAQDFAILRPIALNLLRKDRTSKVGLKNRRLKASASDKLSCATPRLDARRARMIYLLPRTHALINLQSFRFLHAIALAV